MIDPSGIPKVYNPVGMEKKWYDYWWSKGYFTPSEDYGKEPFSIVMPPPNVTGSLHLGHALNNTLQDILCRWRRMQGYNVLWLPGTDHAGIATQARVEENLAKEGLSRHDLGREKFLERVWEWKNKYGNMITNQLRMLGASCDWTRERFTMDEGCSEAVKEVFVRLYEKRLIYRGDYIINWCPKCQTTISDIEVEHIETEGRLYYIKYPVEGEERFVVVATTRPETMLGDTAVAVNPQDERYRDLIGKFAILPVLGRRLPIIADEYVDKDFGTGALKVTPAHDPNDFEMGLRHDLPLVTVMNWDATMNEEAGPYKGMDRYQCREQLVQDLKEGGYLLKIEEHSHAVGHCYRCDSIIEPMVSKQWFVKMKPLAQPAIEKVLAKETRFVPERFTKIYINWMENIKDWCISRQLWWGHRIPVWYCQCGEVICAKEEPKSCPSCGSSELEQDPDVLDTWFSSALWPFSTMGWPKQTRDLEYFYPTSVLVTGRDIIFFWVARMIFSALEFMHEVPFYDVMIHGLVLDALGRKMSKSLGNGIDPIEVIEKYGADTLRFSLVTGSTPGNDIRFHMEKVENTRNFANKVWNASRFVLMNLDGYQPREIKEEDLTLADRWILTRLAKTTEMVTGFLEGYEIGEAAKALYDFIWDEFCDWYIELVKPRLYREGGEAKVLAQNLLVLILTDILKLLHPFMPFITEEIYQHLPGAQESIMIQPWPGGQLGIWEEAEEEMRLVIAVTRALRNLRSEFNIGPSVRVQALVKTEVCAKAEILQKSREYIINMANLKDLTVIQQEEAVGQAVSSHLGDVEVMIPLEGSIDVDKETKRLQKELASVGSEIERLSRRLMNQEFLQKAPSEVVEREKARLNEIKAKKEGIERRLKMLKI